MTRALAVFTVSVFGGLLLWWFAATAGMAIFSGMGIPASLSLVPGYLYTYVVSGVFFAVRYAYIGWPVSVVVVALISWLVTRRQAAARAADPRTGPAAPNRS